MEVGEALNMTAGHFCSPTHPPTYLLQVVQQLSSIYCARPGPLFC